MRFGRVRTLTEVAEYGGQERVRVHATELGEHVGRARSERIVAGWAEFLAAGPSPIRELEFVSRTPRRLFEALAGQTQLRQLRVKWGDYEDLAPLGGMSRLEELTLGASSVRSLEPLRGLTAVRRLELDSLRHVRVLDPLAGMTSVTELDLGGDWRSHRIVHVDSIGFLRDMPQLERLLLHTLIVDDHDYTPILGLPRLRRVRVMRSRGMRPPFEELVAATPWSA